MDVHDICWTLGQLLLDLGISDRNDPPPLFSGVAVAHFKLRVPYGLR